MRISEGWGNAANSGPARTSAFIHIEGGREYRFVISSEVPVRYEGHWTGGGVEPCREGQCALCAAAVGKQVRFVLGVIELESCRAGVWEFGQAVARQFERQGLTGVRLRGLGVRVWKNSASSRGQTTVELDEESTQAAVVRWGLDAEGNVALPEGYDPADVLNAWWKAQGWT